MAETPDEGRSEAPTPFKLKRARERGSVARGIDLGFATSLAAALGALWVLGPDTMTSAAEMMRRSIATAAVVNDNGASLIAVTAMAFASVVRPAAYVGAAMFVVVLIFELVQTGVVFSAQPLAPDFSRLNPATGLKRLFTVKILLETGKNVLKIAVYCGLASLVLRHAWRTEAPVISDAPTLAMTMARVGLRLTLAFLGAAIGFALLDQLIARRQYLRQMRMSRREVRRETREREGDARLKQRRKQLHGQFVKMSQSLRNVRGADLLITNPVHYAVALKYDSTRMDAPKVVSRGSHEFALRLRRLAFFYGVTIIEDPPLARALYSRCQLESEIPDLFFTPVAAHYRRHRRHKEAVTTADVNA